MVAMVAMRLSLVALAGTVALAGSKRLKFVTSLFRHGERTPLEMAPHVNSQPGVQEWVQETGGLGVLTETGKQQHEKVGRAMHKRYMVDTQLLDGSYNPHELFVRSSGIDRCILSASAQLNGLFGPLAAAAMHSVTKADEMVLRGFDPQVCPVIKPMFQANEDALAVPPLFQTVAEAIGTEVTTHNCEHVWDMLEILRSKGLAMNMLSQQQMDELSVHGAASIAARFRGQDAYQLSGSQLARFLLEDMLPLRNDDKKMALLAAHDYTVAHLLLLLGVWDDQIPSFASSVIIEVWEEDGVETVKAFYHNGVDNLFAPAKELKIPGCAGEECTFEEFASILGKHATSKAEFWNRCHPGEEVVIPVASSGFIGGLGWLCFVVAFAAIMHKKLAKSLSVRTQPKFHPIATDEFGLNDPWNRPSRSSTIF